MEDIREQVLEIVNNNVTRISDKLKKANLWDWVVAQVPPDKLEVCRNTAEIIYIALNPYKSPLCPNGRQKYFYNIQRGFSERCNVKTFCPCHTNFIESDSWKERSVIAKQKRKKSFINKWKVENPSQHPDIQQKKIETNQNKFGCDWAPQSSEVKNKNKNTCQERYGVNSGLQLPHVTGALQDYRVAHLEEILEKTRNTNIERCGFPYSSQSEKQKEKYINTCMERYEVPWTTLLPSMKEKSINTCMERYNVSNGAQRKFSEETIQILNDPIILKERVDLVGKVKLSIALNIRFGTLQRYMLKYGIESDYGNSYEIEISEWLNDNNIIFKLHDRTQIKPLELDFYIPDKKFAIEFQGDYWHMNPIIYEATDYNKNIELTAKEIWNRDKYKISRCEEKNILVACIWETDWNENKEYIKDKILKIIKEL